MYVTNGVHVISEEKLGGTTRDDRFVIKEVVCKIYELVLVVLLVCRKGWEVEYTIDRIRGTRFYLNDPHILSVTIGFENHLALTNCLKRRRGEGRAKNRGGVAQVDKHIYGLDLLESRLVGSLFLKTIRIE
jgi:hypothetical protein